MGDGVAEEGDGADVFIGPEIRLADAEGGGGLIELGHSRNHSSEIHPVGIGIALLIQLAELGIPGAVGGGLHESPYAFDFFEVDDNVKNLACVNGLFQGNFIRPLDFIVLQAGVFSSGDGNGAELIHGWAGLNPGDFHLAQVAGVVKLQADSVRIYAGEHHQMLPKAGKLRELGAEADDLIMPDTFPVIHLLSP